MDIVHEANSVAAVEEGGQKKGSLPADASNHSRRYRLQWKAEHHRGPVSSVKFSADGLVVAAASADRTVSLVDSSSGKVLKSLEGHEGGVNDVAWSVDSNCIASASDDCTVRLWDVATGKPACVFSPMRGHLNYVFCLAFSPRGNLLASGSFDESVRLWDLRAGKAVRTIPAHSEPITSVAFNGDGTVLATSSYDGLTRLWDVASGHCLTTLQLEERLSMPPVSCVRFSPNSRFILASSLDGRLRMWDYLLGKPLKTYTGHENLSVCCASTFLPPLVGSEGASASSSSSSAPGRPLSSVEASLASGGEDGRVTVWNVNTRDVISQWQAHEAGCNVLGIDAHPIPAVRGIVTSGGGSTAATVTAGARDFSVKMWTMEQQE